MKLLLDTHVLFWAATDHPRIKLSLAKLRADASEIRDAALGSGFLELPMLGQHALFERSSKLP